MVPGWRERAAAKNGARSLFRLVLRAFGDRLGQHVEIWPHEERLAPALAVITIVGLDHGAHGGQAEWHRCDDEVAELVVALRAVARIGDDGAHDTFGRRAHQ